MQPARFDAMRVSSTLRAMSTTPQDETSRNGLISRMFGGRLWIPLTSLGIFVVIAIVSFIVSVS